MSAFLSAANTSWVWQGRDLSEIGIGLQEADNTINSLLSERTKIKMVVFVSLQTTYFKNKQKLGVGVTIF